MSKVNIPNLSILPYLEPFVVGWLVVGLCLNPILVFSFLSAPFMGPFKSNKTEWSIARALKWSILILQSLALHKIGVEFYQQVNGDIRTSLTAPYDDVRHRATLLKNRNALTNRNAQG